MRSMLKEFYNYIASNTLSFFQARASVMKPGERYCLKLDNDEMVEGVDRALKEITALNNIQGKFEYGTVYSTYTIKLNEDLEVVVASKIDGMTDDFLATLRNAELTDKFFPILMVTCSAIDTITSGTGNLSANGMPFHSSSIISKIKDDIQEAQLSAPDKTLLEIELSRKQEDRFSDKSSLFEYSEILTVLGRGYVKTEDYPAFSLLPDPSAAHLIDEKKIRERIKDNHVLFDQIDRVVKHGNIIDDLEKEYDKTFLDHLQTCKKKNLPWYENYTYDMVRSSKDKLKKKLDNPLQISDTDFLAYSGSPVEYTFSPDDKFFMRDDGDSKAKSRRKNILIYNPDKKEKVSVSIHTNITIKQGWIESNGCKTSTSGREITVDIIPDGCVFAQVIITDLNNNLKYTLRFCVVDVAPNYLEGIRTAYILKTPKNLKKSIIQIYGIKKQIVVNPGKNKVLEAVARDESVYECNYDQTLNIIIDEESIDADTGFIDCVLKSGAITIPIQIHDEMVKPKEITGPGVFKKKHTERKSLEYRDGRVIAGTTDFYVKEPFRSIIATEALFIENGWTSIYETAEGMVENKLSLPEELRFVFEKFIGMLKEKKTLPSLAYYDEKLLAVAKRYVDEVAKAFEAIDAGVTLNGQQNDILLLGCVIKDYDEHSIMMSPLHPLNVMYQIKLLDEQEIGSVRDNLVEKLSPLYLIPFIKDKEKTLYQAIEQKVAPEWRYYAPITNKRYQGARGFVQKLVCDKIIQYKDHFSFLFDDIGNNQMLINLVNMGDCREIFQGLLRFYVQSITEQTDSEELLSFVVNIYADRGMYNEFSLLSDQQKLKEYIRSNYPNEDVNELVLTLTGKVRCFYRNPLEEQYQYAHLTFYEMTSSEDTGASRMDSITTGLSLGGLVSGTPSVLNAEWYKTGFGLKYAQKNQLTRLATYYNALYRVAFSGSSYEPNSGIFTEIEQGQ